MKAAWWRSTIGVGVLVALVNFIGIMGVWAEWDRQARFAGPVAGWIPALWNVFAWPLVTLGYMATHQGFVTVGGHEVDLFMWFIVANAALWGCVAAIVWVSRGARRGQGSTGKEGSEQET